jgi:predicted metalloprotease
MRWSSKGRSSNLEDRRAGGVPRGAILGGGGGIVALILALIFGIPTGGAPGANTAGSAGGTGGAAGSLQTTPEEEKLVDFISWVLDDVQSTWRSEFGKRNSTYPDAKLVLFRDSVDSACGVQGAQVGPFYCPADQKAYIDLGFYRELHERFKAPGDFAQAYVIAHEIGHHIQNVRGTSLEVHQRKQANPAQANELSVRMELQADCLAGVWAHHTNKRGHLDMEDRDEGLRAAAAIGDDALQKGAGRAVRPETFTHGTSEQRKRWFDRGFQGGREEDCNTFDVPNP